MLDLSLAREAPISYLTPVSVAGAALGVAPPAARFILRGADAIVPAGSAFGVPVPTAPRRAYVADARAALWLGPDEWFLIAPAAETQAIQTELQAALGGVAHALVDVSHRQTAFFVEGPGAALLLNAGVPLDLSIPAFPVGAVARTIFDKVEIVLWRQATERFRVEVWRSFAPYLRALLEAARNDNIVL